MEDEDTLLVAGRQHWTGSCHTCNFMRQWGVAWTTVFSKNQWPMSFSYTYYRTRTRLCERTLPSKSCMWVYRRTGSLQGSITYIPVHPKSGSLGWTLSFSQRWIQSPTSKLYLPIYTEGQKVAQSRGCRHCLPLHLIANHGDAFWQEIEPQYFPPESQSWV